RVLLPTELRQKKKFEFRNSKFEFLEWLGPDSNRLPLGLQPSALPNELPNQERGRSNCELRISNFELRISKMSRPCPNSRFAIRNSQFEIRKPDGWRRSRTAASCL